MAELVLTVFVDALMALLLIVTVVYCARLNKRIQVLQDSKSELAQIIQEFDLSTKKATQSIAEIHEATARIAENMQHKIDKANYIADDLQFMIEKGGKVADRMGGGARSGGASSRDDDSERMSGRRVPPGKAKRAVDADMADAEPRDAKSSRASIDSMLKRVRGGNDNDGEADSGEQRTRRPGARLRSKAEQELFEALKAGGSKG